jgi:putative transposase
LIRRIAVENPLWGEERIATSCCSNSAFEDQRARSASTCRSGHPVAAAVIKAGLRFCTITPRRILACDFLVTVTATFRLYYVLVVIHHESRRFVHVNVTSNPTTAWTLQQPREAIDFEDTHRYLIHDRDGIFSRDLDRTINGLGMKVLKSPLHSPKANAICERLIGTIRRECLDRLIPISESHLRLLLKEWAAHYNEGRPHMALGPGIPSPPAGVALCNNERLRHELCGQLVVHSRPVLGGLHHEYSLVSALA